MPPIACSRTPNRRFRPGSSASKSPPPLTSVRFDSRQVGRAAEQLRERPGQGLDRVLARVARGDLLAVGVGLEAGVPAVRRAAPASHAAAELRGEVRVGGRVGVESPRPTPRRAPRRPGSASRKRSQRVVRDVEASCRGPSRRPPSRGGPRRRRAAGRGPSACPGGWGCRSRCGSGPRSGSAGRPRAPP